MEFKIQQIESQSVPHFALAGLSDKAIAKKKKSLVSHQLLKIEKGNPYSNAKKASDLAFKERDIFLENVRKKGKEIVEQTNVFP